LSHCEVPASRPRYELTAQAAAEYEGRREELLQFETQMECLGFTVAAAATISEHLTALFAASEGLLSQTSSIEDSLFAVWATEPQEPKVSCGVNSIPNAQAELGAISMQTAAAIEATARLADFHP
jgi:hypothetical protein